MKLIELLNKIVNSKIKEGVKFKFVKYPQVYEVGIDYFVFGTANLNDEVEIIEEKPQGRWKPKINDGYYFLNSVGEAVVDVWLEDLEDNYRYLTKNVFKTMHEAREYVAYKTALLEAEKSFEVGKTNWRIIFNKASEVLSIQGSFEIMVQGTIYLGTDRDVAQAFVDKWRKQILKYEFGIEE